MLQCASKLSYSSLKEISSSQMGEMVYLYHRITQAEGVLYLESAQDQALHCLIAMSLCVSNIQEQTVHNHWEIIRRNKTPVVYQNNKTSLLRLSTVVD